MPTTSNDLDLDLSILEEEDWKIECNHYAHQTLQRGHSDDSPVIAVDGLQLRCCGYRPKATYLCSSWIKANPTLRCHVCGQGGILFEDVFILLGPA